MRAWQDLPLEKRNALVILVIFLVALLIAFLTVRPRTSPPIIKLWERMHGDLPGQWHEIVFSPDGKYVISAAQTVKIWRTKDGQLVRSFPLTVKDAVKTLSPDGRWIATYEKNGAVKLWKMPESKVVRTLKGERGKVLLLAFSPDGKFLAAASHDLGVVKVWRTENGELVRTLSIGAKKILNLAVSSNGELLGTVVSRFNPKLGHRVCLELWYLSTSTRLSSVEMPISLGRCYYLLPPSTSVWMDRASFSFSPDGEFLFAAGVGMKGYTVAFWNMNNVKTNHQIVLKGRFMAMGVHPRDSSFFFVHEDISRDLLTPLRPGGLTVPAFWVYGDVLTCWRLTKSGLTKCWEAKNLVSGSFTFIDPTSAFAFSPDGQLMALVTMGGRIKLFRLKTSSMQEN